MVKIQFEQVSKVYANGVTAVRDLNLTILPGEFLVLVGPSGCGKTTTLRLLAGLESISRGNLYLGDRRVNDLPPRDRNIAMVFQSYALYPHLTVFGNLAFSLQLLGLSAADIRQRVEAVAAQLGLETLLHRKPGQLSGGQRQRVALGRAIVREPAVFLMDEPLSNLDVQLRLQARAELLKLHKTLGTTVVYVTHDQGEAMTLGSRIAVMEGGILQQVATPAALYAKPINTFVASFMGSPPMNLLTGQLIQLAGESQFHCKSLQLVLPAQKSAILSSNTCEDLTLGIRPEHIYRVPDTDPNAITAQITLVEHLGHENILYLTLPGGQEIIARVPADATGATDELIAIRWDCDRLHYFDSATGQAL
jgi:multiple sugar transport system ATP-binding protein